MDVNTIVAYGIDLGGPTQGWKIHEADPDGYWDPEWHDHGSIISCAERLLLSNAGLDPDDDVLEEARGLEFHPYRMAGKASWILAAWSKIVYVGDILELSWPYLNQQRIDEGWDARLIEATEVMGINSVNGPTWIVAPYAD